MMMGYYTLQHLIKALYRVDYGDKLQGLIAHAGWAGVERTFRPASP